MTRDEHIQLHRDLHQSLVNLIADYNREHGNGPLRNITALDLMIWSQKQTVEPGEFSLEAHSDIDNPMFAELEREL